MQDAKTALEFISSDDRETWVNMGMALKSEHGESARDMWMDWSRQSDSFKESDARAVWKSFNGTGITISSLFHEARQNGYRNQSYQRPTQAQIDAKNREAEARHTLEGKERFRRSQLAAEKAKWVLGQCTHEQHAYLQLKGFPDLVGLVWRPTPEHNLLCVPMYIGKVLTGLQMINKDGVKKFLVGQVTTKAEFCIDSGGFNQVDWWVEGYASGLSLKSILAALKQKYRIHVTFSAHNLQRMAHSGNVIADNDASRAGQNAAEATGLPIWMPLDVGQDINDVHKALGTFRASQMMGTWLKEQREEKEFYA